MELLGHYLQDVILLQMPQFSDERGAFVKIFNTEQFLASGLSFEIKEVYYSRSHKDVIRGMHFQLPPHQHAKVVFCSEGSILDVVVDLRKASPTYGQYAGFELSRANGHALYIPEGFAHGFKSLEDGTVTQYLVSSVYNKEADTGIAYDSFGFDWACAQPVMSQRDKNFSILADFDSPF